MRKEQTSAEAVFGEVRRVMMNLGEKLTNDEVSYLLDGMEDLNGMVNYDVFIKKVMSDSENPDTE